MEEAQGYEANKRMLNDTVQYLIYALRQGNYREVRAESQSIKSLCDRLIKEEDRRVKNTIRFD